MGKSEWIPVSIKPEETAKGLFCLIERNGKLYPETCYYFNKHQEDFCPDGNEDWADFENDEYYLPEGWYTLCDQCEKYWKVEPSFYMVGIDYPDSHSPTEPVSEFDTLQERDWFQGTEEEYRKVLELQGDYDEAKVYMNYLVMHGVVFDESRLKTAFPQYNLRKTQLTAPEFLRRAENTFNNQK